MKKLINQKDVDLVKLYYFDIKFASIELHTNKL
jgi:hypothetical protein